MRSAAVKRIEDVLTLRARQFREDDGPLAHPVRPEEYIEINNFYTATVYEKGAELIGMLKRLVGDEAYARALDLYFERHDGQAATIEDWLTVFEDATGRDLAQFKLWYSEAGTPRLKVSDRFEDGRYTLEFEQVNPPTPGQPVKQPKVIPVAVGLLNPNGDEVLPTTVLEMTEPRQSFTFEGLGARPVPSILRGFSAPVVLERETSPEERAFLLAHDTDPFNKWGGRTGARQGRAGPDGHRGRPARTRLARGAGTGGGGRDARPGVPRTRPAPAGRGRHGPDAPCRGPCAGSGPHQRGARADGGGAGRTARTRARGSHRDAGRARPLLARGPGRRAPGAAAGRAGPRHPPRRRGAGRGRLPRGQQHDRGSGRAGLPARDRPRAGRSWASSRRAGPATGW